MLSEAIGKISLLLSLGGLGLYLVWLYGTVLSLRRAVWLLQRARSPEQQRSKNELLEGLTVGEWIEVRTPGDEHRGFYHGHQNGVLRIKEKQDIVAVDLNRIILLRRRRLSAQMDEGLWPEEYSRVLTPTMETRYPWNEI